MRFDFIELLGWAGTVSILVAYALVSFGVLSPTQAAYPLLNALGSAGIVLVSFRRKDWQPTALNVVWVAIAVVALIRLI